MFCKHCGKEIEDESSFCKYCGKPVSGSKKESTNKSAWIIYLIWVFSNMYLLMGEKDDWAYRRFFPNLFDYNNVWDKDYYDFSEFVVYVFILPTIIYVIYRRYNKLIEKVINKILNK